MYLRGGAPRRRLKPGVGSIDAQFIALETDGAIMRLRKQLADLSAQIAKIKFPTTVGNFHGVVGAQKQPPRVPKGRGNAAKGSGKPRACSISRNNPLGPRYTPTPPFSDFSIGFSKGGAGRPHRVAQSAPRGQAHAAKGPAPSACGRVAKRSFTGVDRNPPQAQGAGHPPAPSGTCPPPSKGRWAQQLRIPAEGNPTTVVRKLLGPGGSHVRGIAERHGAKLRVRGIGSGHAEGRARKEAQVPLHLCVSAATQRGLEGAMAEAKILIARATGTTGKATAKRTTVRLALVNEGKPSDASSFALCGWAHANEVDACLVSEGALSGRSLVTDHGYTWEAPLKQTKGGAGFLVGRKAAAVGGKVRLVQCPRRCWSLAAWQTAGGVGLMVAYINPQDVKNREVLTSFLSRLSSLLASATRWVVGGDFNAPSGSTQRRILDCWCEEVGLTLANPGAVTHVAGPEHAGTDLDLILVRGVSVRLLTVQDPFHRGHARQLFEFDEEAAPRVPPAPAPFAWKRLSCAKVQGKFVAAVKAAMTGAPSLENALELAAAKTLGRVPGPSQASRPLPPGLRQELRVLRQSARALPRGSPEHQEVSRKIGALMRKHKQAQWRSTLTKLASAEVVEDDTWRLLRYLRKSSPTTRMVGIPDVEIRDAFKTIYQSNATRRPDWIFSTAEGRGTSGEGSVPELDAPFTSDEVKRALSTLPNRKAPGLDGLPHEAYKALSRDPSLLELMAEQASALLAGAAVPSLEGRLVTIPKSGAAESAAEMRPLMMLPTSRKLVEKLVAGRLERLAEVRGSDGLCPLQGGFRRGLGVNRQLVLAEVAIVDAKRQGLRRRFVGLDLVKAFDRIPKEFAAHCAAGYLGPFCPRLASLVARLALSPFEARVGGHDFAVSTGVPQGGILSPWLFVMAMNDLALRLGGAGGAVVGEQEVGTLLYADDILLVDDSVASSEARCRLTKEWVEEWGGAIHPRKTQWLEVNAATSSPAPAVQEGPNSGGAIDFLGVTITPNGIKPKVGPGVFANMLSAAGSTMEVRGLAPAPALQTIRSVAWAQVSHGSVVTLPCAVNLTNKWLGSARQVLCTFARVHRAELIRELGLLYHPVAWLCRAVIRFYGSALTTAGDPVLKRVLSEIVGSPEHPLRRKVEATLSPCGVTWEELAAVPVPDLIRKADARLREWSRSHLLDEAERLGLHRGDAAPLWREWSDGPRKYLYEENARYGFMFRRSSFAPPDVETVACYFCGAPGADTGRHLLRCEVAGAEVPLPEELRLLDPVSLEKVLLLEDATPKQHLKAVLGYMRLLSQARKTRQDRSPQPVVRRSCTSNPQFFRCGRPTAADPPGPPRSGGDAGDAEPPRRRAARKRARSADADGEADDGEGLRQRPQQPLPSPPTPLPLSLLAAEEVDEITTTDILVLLDEPCHELPPSPRAFPVPDAEGPIAASRKRGRESEDEQLPAAKRDLRDTVIVPAVPPPPVSGPTSSDSGEDESGVIPDLPVQRKEGWTAEEAEQLARAILLLGDSSAGRLASSVPSRTVRQIRMRLRTTENRRVVERMRAASGGSGQPACREAPATVQPIALAPNPPVSQTPEAATQGSTAQRSTDVKQYSSGRWTSREILLFHAAIEAHNGEVTGALLSSAVGTRSAIQCLERMREKTTKEFIVSLSLPARGGEPSTVHSGRWDAPEIRRLEAAMNQLGSCTQYAELASLLGNRTWAQVSVKVNDLLRAGKLRQPSSGSFVIDA